MITYALIDKLANDNSRFVLDKNLFWEELPLQRDGSPALGVWAITRGGSSKNSLNGLNQKTVVDFYIAEANKAKAEAEANEIYKWSLANNAICELSGTLGGENYSYKNIRLWQTSTPQNQGTTPNGAIVKMISLIVIYDN